MSTLSRSILLPIVALCLVAFQANLTVAQVRMPPNSSHPSTLPAGGLIAIACEQAKHKDFCIRLLNSDKNSQTADLRGLAYIGLRLAEKNATQTSVFIKQALNKPDSDGGSDWLAECSEHYITAVELIEDSISSLVSDKYAEVNNLAKAAVADLDSCDAGLAGEEGGAGEIASKNRDIRMLINTALTVVHVAASSKPSHPPKPIPHTL